MSSYVPRPKQILWITTDHQRFDCVGSNGNPAIQTPVLDKLAARGVSFDHCFVQNPLCMPSRASFMTGLYPSQTGVMCNGQALPTTGVASVADHFNAGGWKTAQIGKLHFQPHEDHDLDPRARHHYGFGYFCLSEEPGCYRDAYTTWLKSEFPEFAREMQVGRPSGSKRGDEKLRVVKAPPDASHAGFCAYQTNTYLRRHGAGSLVHCGIYAPHPPLNPTQAMLDLYDQANIPEPQNRKDEHLDKPDPVRSAMMRHQANWSAPKYAEFRRYFYAMCSLLDQQVGRIVKQLDERRELDDTLILFMSDHGDMLGDHHLMSKGHVTFYPQVMRVPCIMHWPKGLPGGKRVTGLTEAVDLLPTLLDLAGCPVPSYLPGRSLAEGLRTGNPQSLREDVFAQHAQPGEQPVGYCRTKEYAYVRYGREREILYDLREDPEEFRNVAGDAARQDALHEMRERMLARSLEAGASRLARYHGC